MFSIKTLIYYLFIFIKSMYIASALRMDHYVATAVVLLRMRGTLNVVIRVQSVGRVKVRNRI